MKYGFNYETAIGYYQIYMMPELRNAYNVACSMKFGGPVYDSKNSHKKTNFKNKRKKR